MNLLLEEVASQLPPYAPELNAIEKAWQYLRDRYLSGRLFPGTRAIVDACCDAWNNLVAEPGRIRSLADFEWARPVIPSCAWNEHTTYTVPKVRIRRVG